MLQGGAHENCFQVNVFRFRHPTRAGQQTQLVGDQAAVSPCRLDSGESLEVQGDDKDEAPAPPPKKEAKGLYHGGG
jgi:hypothetical protein